jgi:hypothetical protein
MISDADAKKAAEKEGTAQTDWFRRSFRIYYYTFAGIAVVLQLAFFPWTIGYIPSLVGVAEESSASAVVSPSVVRERSTQVPLATQPIESWPAWTIPPKGISPSVIVPVGMHILVSGNDWLLHTLYLDGDRCSGLNCPSKPIKETYVENTKSEPNTVRYAFGRR